jgi:hypothetical protein
MSSVGLLGRFGEEEVPGLSGSAIGPGLGLPGLPGSLRLPDWPGAGTLVQRQRNAMTIAMSQ